VGLSLITGAEHLLSCLTASENIVPETRISKKLSMLYISTNNKEKTSLNDLSKDGSVFYGVGSLMSLTAT